MFKSVAKTVGYVVGGILVSAAGNLLADTVKIKYLEHKVKKMME